MTPQPAAAKPRYNSWFVTVPLALGGLAFVFWFYRPTLSGIGELRAELELKQLALAEAVALPQKLRQVNQQLAETREFVATRRGGLEAPRLADVFGEITSIVSASGAKTTRLEPEPVVRMRCLNRVPVTLACEGSFPQVYRMLRRLEQMPHTIWIEDLHVTREAKEGAVVKCVLKLAMFTGQANFAEKAD